MSFYDSGHFPNVLHGTTRIAVIKRNQKTHRPVQLCVNKESAFVKVWSTADSWFFFLVFYMGQFAKHEKPINIYNAHMKGNLCNLLELR